jgi:hypothetical protein
MRTFDHPHPMYEIRNHMPKDEFPQPQFPSEGWAELQERALPADAERNPGWFTAHRNETDDRFRSLHDAVRALHDRVLGVLGKRRSVHGDKEIEDPDIVSGSDSRLPPNHDRFPFGKAQPAATSRGPA